MQAAAPRSAARVLFASLVGTTIEFFDFYIYATAAVLVFPKLFFPAGDPAAATLQSLATFALAFFARPIGSALFGHFGDRIGRKATLVAALLTMGLSTVRHRSAADLRDDRRCRAAAARAVPFRPGARARRRVGRGGAAGDRERAAGQARVVRHVPAARRAARVLCARPACFCCCRSTLSDAAVLRLGLAHAVSRERAAGVRRPVRAPAARGDAGVPARDREQRARARADARRSSRSIRACLCSGRSLRSRRSCVFYLMTVFSLAGARARSATAPGVPDPADDRRAVLRADDPDLGGARGSRTAAAPVLIVATLGDHRVRPGVRAAVRLGQPLGVRRVPVARPGADGPDLRTARHGAGRAVSDRRALHRGVARVQSRGHLRRLAGALHRDLAGAALRLRRCRSITLRALACSRCWP